MPGTVLEIAVKKGQRVREGQHLMTLEAMKMEHKVLAPRAGEVAKVNFSEGDKVDMGSPSSRYGQIDDMCTNPKHLASSERDISYVCWEG